MPQTLMEVGMQIVADISIGLDEMERFGINHKLLLEPTAFRCLIVSVGDITDSDTLRAVLSTNPVCIGQVDANGSRRILVAT